MMRYPDWPERLAAYIEQRRHAPFKWAEQDCATFAFDAVEAMTGADPIADLRGRWTTARGAARILNRLGGLEAATSAYLGEPKSATFAQRGDVVIVPIGGRDSLAICTGVVLAGAGVSGIEWWPMTQARLAWSV